MAVMRRQACNGCKTTECCSLHVEQLPVALIRHSCPCSQVCLKHVSLWSPFPNDGV